MTERDADQRAEMREHAGRGRGGTAMSTGGVRQAATARGDTSNTETSRLMEEVLRRENLIRAQARVVKNGGAAGVDGMTVEELMPYCREHWARIREELLQGTYTPQPVRRVDIPKPGGSGPRTLGIPTVLDRLIQQAVLQVLQPIVDPTFSDGSFGFRPGRSAHDAVRRARGYIAAGFRWVVDLDLEKFFDRVNHDVLMARVARRVKDQRVLLLIRRYLHAGMMDGGLVSPRLEGTPQGGPLSPLLSNILLDDLDRELEHRGHRFARYADDCNVYVQSRTAGERVLTSLERFLAKRLRLRVNREKSAVARPWQRKFLGYSVTWHREPKLRVAPQSLERLKARLRLRLRAGRGRSVSHTVADLTPLLRGWVGYFRLAEVKSHFEALDTWLRRRCRCILWRQWKRPRTRAKELIRRGLDPTRARISAYNGHGPWWNAGASHMHAAVPTAVLRGWGLLSLLDEQRRLQGAL
ncbi:MAG TPA: group II intron reverse transcriptase/maturase [Gemmatimonadales bacterium]|jgi:RNA-directed DNA polymerase|nr:group II intron reverse transcriptase/maturase [Gemmatimonadales bacterium]